MNSNDSTPTLTSIVTAPSTSTAILMNKKVTADDSLYYMAARLKHKLEQLPQLKPYLNYAQASAELLAERQAVLLSQKNATAVLRRSGISESELSTSSTSSTESSLLTFAVGVLPISIHSDPVTLLWRLFQQGSPLCVIFNAASNSVQLEVVSSDDIKVCKKSIYDFILACKTHFSFKSEELFTISDIFSSHTDDLIKVMEVINTVLDACPRGVLSEEKPEPVVQENRVVREIVESERKYVYDLEILQKYKTQLLENNIASSEELYILFPNLNEILDFQRRFLVGLEINGAIPELDKQRIGSLFLHAQEYFKMYEPWSIGQNAAIEFISGASRDSMKGLIIENKLELQSFLLKPVQRLCKYPLLLKEILAQCPSQELEDALEISRGIAMNINENQRRTENHEEVKRLYDRVTNWKGYRVAKFGELLYFDKVFMKVSNSQEPEQQFEVYLFEKIIVLFGEIVQSKKSSITSLKKRSGSSLILTNANGDSKLELRGRIMIINLQGIVPSESHLLTITWESPKENGTFVLRFKNEETRNNWEASLRNLQKQIRTESRTSSQLNGFESNTASMISLERTISRPFSELHGRRNTRQSIESDYQRSMSDNFKTTIPDTMLLVRIAFNSDVFTVLVGLESGVEDVLGSIKRKLMAHVPNNSVEKIKYQDEDGDYVVMSSEDDWQVAKEMLRENGERVLNVWVN